MEVRKPHAISASKISMLLNNIEFTDNETSEIERLAVTELGLR
jgi:hypothetical protein